VQKTARGACCSSRGRINVVWGGKNLFCVLQKVKVTKLAGAVGISNATQIKLSLVIRSSLVWLSGLVATACAKRRNSAIADKQLSLTNRATRLQVSQGHQTWYHSIC